MQVIIFCFTILCFYTLWYCHPSTNFFTLVSLVLFIVLIIMPTLLHPRAFEPISHPCPYVEFSLLHIELSKGTWGDVPFHIKVEVQCLCQFCGDIRESVDSLCRDGANRTRPLFHTKRLRTPKCGSYKLRWPISAILDFHSRFQFPILDFNSQFSILVWVGVVKYWVWFLSLALL